MNKKLCYVYNSVQRVYYLPFYSKEEADLTKCITGWPICLEHQAYWETMIVSVLDTLYLLSSMISYFKHCELLCVSDIADKVNVQKKKWQKNHEKICIQKNRHWNNFGNWKILYNVESGMIIVASSYLTKKPLSVSDTSFFSKIWDNLLWACDLR